jgi:hypothetical protein
MKLYITSFSLNGILLTPNVFKSYLEARRSLTRGLFYRPSVVLLKKYPSFTKETIKEIFDTNEDYSVILCEYEIYSRHGGKVPLIATISEAYIT